MHKIIFLFLIVVFWGCSPAWKSKIAEYERFSDNSSSLVPDYSSLEYWAAHPQKQDPADSTPAFLLNREVIDTAADVFFIHPTTYTDATFTYGWNAPILQKEINAKTDYTTILYQASIFNFTRHVYAPRYRQANYFTYFEKDTSKMLPVFRLAYADVKMAFQYYLTHYNHGRPIIIASHSQGSTHAKFLLKEFFDGKPLQKQLVAAYVVGMPVEPDWFKSIQPCKNPEQTGCICSWRTFKSDYEDEFVAKEKFTAIVTNPLTWSASEPMALADQNPGGVLKNFNRLVPRVCGANIHNGILWVNKLHFFGSMFYASKNLHIVDFNLYYMSVRQNARHRLKAWSAVNARLK